jgi:hypothetical protein
MGQAFLPLMCHLKSYVFLFFAGAHACGRPQCAVWEGARVWGGRSSASNPVPDPAPACPHPPHPSSPHPTSPHPIHPLLPQAWLLIMGVFTWMFVPETKGVPIEAIDELLIKKHWFWGKASGGRGERVGP